MTESDLVPVDVPPEQLRVGDLLIDEEGYSETVESVFVDAVPDYVYAFTPQQRPLRRDTLVRVHRPRSQVGPPPPAVVTPAELAEVRDLALALADWASPDPERARSANDRVKRSADRVRSRLEESTDGPAGPDAPVLGEPPAPAGGSPEPVEPPAGDGTTTDGGTPPPPDPRGPRRDR